VIDTGLKVDDCNFAVYLKQNKYNLQSDSNLEEQREEYSKTAQG
jgi:hypothetical protein